MGQWLIADISVSDVHFQLWMLLVAEMVSLLRQNDFRDVQNQAPDDRGGVDSRAVW